MTNEMPKGPPIDLEAFARLNPESTIEPEEDAFLVQKPWGDDSMVLRVSHEARAVAEALNSLRLPTRFSAIWHADTHDVEFIFASVMTNDELRSRHFTFEFEGRSPSMRVRGRERPPSTSCQRSPADWPFLYGTAQLAWHTRARSAQDNVGVRR